MSQASPAPTESLNQLFRDLHAHRVQTMDPAVLKTNIDQRQELEDTADRSRFIRAGDPVGPFSLPEVEGGTVTLDRLLERGPAVLIFFRYEGCPACNLALPYYQRQLAPGLRALGASLVAISPQVPEKLNAIKQRHRLDYHVASDIGNALAHRFGIVYSANQASRTAAEARGAFIGDVTGTRTWELPIPTVVVIGRDRRVSFADVHPDWLIRTEAQPILDAVEALVSAPVSPTANAEQPEPATALSP